MATHRTWQNWARNQTAYPTHWHEPADGDELRDLVRAARTARNRVKVVGAGHSFTSIAVADQQLVSLDRYNRILEVDTRTGEVTVEAGVRLYDLIPQLDELGLALPNLGDIAYQSVAGATSTSTHGTGLGYQSIAAAISGLEIITGTGEVVWADADTNTEIFQVARVGLGALGVVSKVRLQCVPAFNLRATETSGPLAHELDDFFGHAESTDHYEFFWFPHTDSVVAKRNNRTDEPPSGSRPVVKFVNEELLENVVFGALLRLGRRRPSLVPRLAAVATGAAGSRSYVSSSADVFTSPRRNRFYEMEYAVPYEHGPDAFERIRRLIDDLDHPVSFPIEVRVLGGDDIPLSTASDRRSVYLAVHMMEGTDYQQYFAAVEAIMHDYEGRPHWGKIHFQTASTLRDRYPEFDRFLAVRDELDPARMFTNAYLDRVLGR